MEKYKLKIKEGINFYLLLPSIATSNAKIGKITSNAGVFVLWSVSQ